MIINTHIQSSWGGTVFGLFSTFLAMIWVLLSGSSASLQSQFLPLCCCGESVYFRMQSGKGDGGHNETITIAWRLAWPGVMAGWLAGLWRGQRWGGGGCPALSSWPSSAHVPTSCPSADHCRADKPDWHTVTQYCRHARPNLVVSVSYSCQQ